MDSQSAYARACLACSLTIETIGQASISKHETCRSAKLLLGRNEFSEPVLQAHLGQVMKRFSLNAMKIHRRFMKEGKTTISLPNDKIQLLISNCPPDKLLIFLKTLVGKLAKHTTLPPAKQVTARERIFACASNDSFTEISPLCDEDVQCVRASTKHPSATPTGTKSIKRKRDGEMASDEKENAQPGGGKGGSKVARRNISLTRSPMELTRDQYRVLEAITSGKNVFFTGSAGTGKSLLLRRALGSLPPEHTFATASTGIAASHINGMTLHSFAGIGSGKASLNDCIALANRSVVSAQWKKCKHLIIDEISMVHGEYFAKLEAVARVIRKSEQPFGGIQLIVCGDFLQLPPVDKASNDSKKMFAFQTSAWRRCIEKSIELMEVKRQTDSSFIDILQQIRRGYCPPLITKILTQTAAHRLHIHGLQATKLSPRNDDVDEINDNSLDCLPGECCVFTAQDSDPSMSKRLSDLCPASKEIRLKKGAQVMICKNIDVKEGLVNGTRGVVIGFEKGSSGFPVIRLLNGKEVTIQPHNFTFKYSGGITLVRRQLPLKLAWAVSIHKSQGMTLDLVEMSLGRVFEYGQAYVALSRARSLKGLRVLEFSAQCVKAHPKVIEFYDSLETDSN
ncbi:ATP-dependent DNA helicase PIF1-like [Watersipora subatra]|uniref:ATP-dependent DNA helicase PIF1-like n=1 Tax=Watersipora subatra TaxID=2589382 RepID=UPI00355B285D